MQQRNLIGLGILFCASTAAVIACGDSADDPAAEVPTPGKTSGDPGSTSSSSGGGGGTSSSSGGGVKPPDAGVLPPTANLVVGHGYNEIGPIKICFAQSAGAAPDETTPLPAVLPLPRGGAGVLPPGAIGVLPKLGVNLSEVHLLTYAIRASALVGKEAATCDQIAGGSQTLGLVKGTDYFVLPPQPKGDYKDGKTYLIFVRPASSAPANDAGLVGALDLFTQELDTTTEIAADKVGIQYVNGSSYLPPTAPFLFRPGAETDAGNDPRKEFFAGADLITSGAPATPVFQVAPFEPVNDTGFGVRFPTSPTTTLDILHEVSGVKVPVTQWAALSDSTGVQSEPTADGGTSSLYFQTGRAFTFVLWGDPALGPNPYPTSDPRYGLEALRRPHLTVIPNKPKVPALQ